MIDRVAIRMLLLRDFRFVWKSVHQFGRGIALKRRGLLLPTHCDDCDSNKDLGQKHRHQKKKAESK